MLLESPAFDTLCLQTYTEQKTVCGLVLILYSFTLESHGYLNPISELQFPAPSSIRITVAGWGALSLA